MGETSSNFLPSCLLWSRLYLQPHELPWIFRSSFAVMALMSFGIGANDAANSWGTSVGSGAIKMSQAVLIGGLMDWLGATLMGSGVSDTIQRVSDLESEACWACGKCNSKLTLFMLAMAMALLAAAVFLVLSSVTSMPVSTTHAVIGAVVGVTAVGTKASCLDIPTLAGIVASWVTSPILAGVIGVALHVGLKRVIIDQPDADQRALRACPVLVAITMTCMTALVMFKSPLMSHLAWWWVAIGALGVGLASFSAGYYWLVPHILHVLVSAQVDGRVIELQDASSSAARQDDKAPAHVLAEDEEDAMAELHSRIGSAQLPQGAGTLEDEAQRPPLVHWPMQSDQQEDADGMLDVWGAVLPSDPPQASPGAIPGMFAGEQYEEPQRHALFVFRYLLVFVAAVQSFAHGANDTANATGAFGAIWAVYEHGDQLGQGCSFGRTPVWVMAMAGFFVFIGVYFLGHRVIRTMGFGLANINFFRGFCIELSSAMSVVLATVFRMPVSTTHCQVGAVIFVSWSAFGPSRVKWRMFGWIALTWVVTLPLSAGLAAILLAATQSSIKA